MLVGLGEGVAPPAGQAILARIVPATERSRAVTMFYGGMDVGSVVGLLASVSDGAIAPSLPLSLSQSLSLSHTHTHKHTCV